MNNEKKETDPSIPVVSAAQHFREECLADRGYKFVRKEGSTAIWNNIGIVTTIEAAVDNNGKCIFTEIQNAKARTGMSQENWEYTGRTCCASWESAAINGGCNFCTRNTERMVWVIRSSDEHRHLEIRLCAACMTDIRKQTHNR